MTPAELLNRLEKNLHCLPVDVAGWLAAGLRRYRHDMALEQALELSGPGARRHRDAALRRAAELIAPGERPWKQAEVLRKAINYMAGATRRDPGALEQLTGFRLEIARALNCGLPVPRSRRGLYDILITENEAAEISVQHCETSNHQ